MRFGKSILSPNYFRKPDFNSLVSIEKSFDFECINCNHKVKKTYVEIIGREFSWHSDFYENTYNKIKEFFDVNAVNKTPDGGWTAVDKCFCDNCKTEYLIYAGVNEYSDSCYKITLQGITEILNESN